MFKICFIRDLEDQTTKLSKLKDMYVEEKLRTMMHGYELDVLSLPANGKFDDWLTGLKIAELQAYDLIIGYRLGATIIIKLLQLTFHVKENASYVSVDVDVSYGQVKNFSEEISFCFQDEIINLPGTEWKIRECEKLVDN